MDFFICLPVLFGCDRKLKFEDGPQRLCPRCNNGAVHPAKSKQWFSICWVPLVPMSSKQVWVCGICQWEVRRDKTNGWEPQVAGQGYMHPGQQQFMPMQHQGGPQQGGFKPNY